MQRTRPQHGQAAVFAQDLVLGSRCRWCVGPRAGVGQLDEMSIGGLMMRAVGRGVKACVTRGVLAFGWGVPQDAGDEFFGAQGDGFLGVVAVVTTRANLESSTHPI